MSKTKCSVKFLYASLTSREHRETQGSLNTSLPEGVPQSLRKWKVRCVPGTMDSTLKNPWLRPLKAARPGPLHGSAAS